MRQAFSAIKVGLWLLLCLVLLLRAFIWMQQSMPDFPSQNLVEHVDGTGRAPFVYRALLPQAVGLVEALTPKETQQALADFTRGIVMAYTSTVWSPSEIWTKSDRFYFLRFVAGVFMLLLLAGYGAMLWRLAGLLMPETTARWFAPLVGLFMVPIGEWRAAYLYDAGTLFLFAWAFYLMLSGQFKLYLLCFVLACFNRETACFLILLYALLWYDSLPRRKFYLLLAFQLIAWLLAMLSVRLAFSDAISGYSFHFYSNLRLITKGLGVADCLMLLTFTFLLCFHWQSKPEPLKKTIWIIGLALLLWFGFGRFQEVRAVYEIFVFLTLMLTHSLVVVLHPRDRSERLL